MFMQNAIFIGYFKSIFKSCIESDDHRSRIFNIREAFRFNTFYVRNLFFQVSKRPLAILYEPIKHRDRTLSRPFASAIF